MSKVDRIVGIIGMYIKQPSTKVGLVTLASVFSINVGLETLDGVSELVLLFIGIYEVIRNEKI